MIPAFVLSWKSPTMPAPAFWYFSTRSQATTAAAKGLQPGAVYAITPALIPEAKQGVIDHVR